MDYELSKGPAVDLDWVKRCHAVKVKELEDRILVLERENEEWEEFCTELQNEKWKKNYDKLHSAVEQARSDLREALYDE